MCTLQSVCFIEFVLVIVIYRRTTISLGSLFSMSHSLPIRKLCGYLLLIGWSSQPTNYLANCNTTLIQQYGCSIIKSVNLLEIAKLVEILDLAHYLTSCIASIYLLTADNSKVLCLRAWLLTTDRADGCGLQQQSTIMFLLPRERPLTMFKGPKKLASTTI